MKADSKLWANSFSVTRQLFSWSSLSSRHLHVALDTWVTSRMFLMKQHFVCVGQLIVTTVLYGKLKILTMLLNVSAIHRRSMS